MSSPNVFMLASFSKKFNTKTGLSFPEISLAKNQERCLVYLIIIALASIIMMLCIYIYSNKKQKGYSLSPYEVLQASSIGKKKRQINTNSKEKSENAKFRKRSIKFSGRKGRPCFSELTKDEETPSSSVPQCFSQKKLEEYSEEEKLSPPCKAEKVTQPLEEAQPLEEEKEDVEEKDDLKEDVEEKDDIKIEKTSIMVGSLDKSAQIGVQEVKQDEEPNTEIPKRMVISIEERKTGQEDTKKVLPGSFDDTDRYERSFLKSQQEAKESLKKTSHLKQAHVPLSDVSLRITMFTHKINEIGAELKEIEKIMDCVKVSKLPHVPPKGIAKDFMEHVEHSLSQLSDKEGIIKKLDSILDELEISNILQKKNHEKFKSM